jgi:hypothetical protein
MGSLGTCCVASPPAPWGCCPAAPAHERIRDALVDVSAACVVIGTTAMVAHGARTSVDDLDLFVDPDRVGSVVSALTSALHDVTHQGLRITFTVDDQTIDIYTRVASNESFEAVAARASDGGPLRVAALVDLERMLIAANRPKDRRSLGEVRRLRSPH